MMEVTTLSTRKASMERGPILEISPFVSEVPARPQVMVWASWTSPSNESKLFYPFVCLIAVQEYIHSLSLNTAIQSSMLYPIVGTSTAANGSKLLLILDTW